MHMHLWLCINSVILQLELWRYLDFVEVKKWKYQNQKYKIKSLNKQKKKSLVVDSWGQHYQRCDFIHLSFFPSKTVNFMIASHPAHRDKTLLSMWTAQDCQLSTCDYMPPFSQSEAEKEHGYLKIYIYNIYFFNFPPSSGIKRIYCGDLWGWEMSEFSEKLSLSLQKGLFLDRKFVFEWRESRSASAVKPRFDQSPSAPVLPCIVQQLSLHQVRWWLSNFSFQR